MSYSVIAEAALFLYGPQSSLSSGFLRDAVIISRQMPYQDVVMNSWPIAASFDRFQTLHNGVANQLGGLNNTGPAETDNVKQHITIDVIVCRCGSLGLRALTETAERNVRDLNLETDDFTGLLDLEQRLEGIDRKETRLFIQETCLPILFEREGKQTEKIVGNSDGQEATNTTESNLNSVNLTDNNTSTTIVLDGPALSSDLFAKEYAMVYPKFRHIQTTTLATRQCTPVLPEDFETADYTVMLGYWARRKLGAKVVSSGAEDETELGEVNDRYFH